MESNDNVQRASEAFYGALNEMLAGDASSLSDIWVQSPEATTMHPIGSREVGWDDIKASFERVARSSEGGHVEMTERLIRVHGNVAHEVGVEIAQFSVAGTPLHVNSRVTNIYYRIDGFWRIVHHHGDRSSGIAEALAKADG